MKVVWKILLNANLQMWQSSDSWGPCWWLGGWLDGQGGRRFWKTRLGRQQEAAEWGEEAGSECNQTVSREQFRNLESYKVSFFSRLIPRKKSQGYNEEVPTHLDMTVRNLIFDILMWSSIWAPDHLHLFRTFVSRDKTWGCWSTQTGITSSNF